MDAPGGGAGGEDWLSLPEYFKTHGFLMSTYGSGSSYPRHAYVA